MTETPREMNKQAIKDGLLLPGSSSLRQDFSCNLGQPLSQLEDKFYRFISELTSQGPVSMEALIRKYYSQNDETFCDDRNAVWELIKRVRGKLGKTAIINKRGLGYLSRRALINSSAPTRN